MGYSAKVVLRRPARKDGTCQVRLMVVLDGRPVPIGLGVNWPPAIFNEAAGRCLAYLPPKERGPGYAEQLAAATNAAGGMDELVKMASDYNLIIGKANDIFVECRLTSQPLSVEQFLQEYNTEVARRTS